MNIEVNGNRCKTTSPFDRKVLLALNKLEGMKRWLANRVFSFENTPYNLEVWRQTFPNFVATGLAQPTGDASAVLPAPACPTAPRPPFAYHTPPRQHQAKAIAKLYRRPAFGLFLDIGCGKSWTAIAVLGLRWCAGLSDHVLLIAPNGVHEQWVEEQLPKHMSKVVPWKAWTYSHGTKRAKAEYEALKRFDGLKVLAINIDAISTKNAEAVLLDFLRAANGKAHVIVDESQDIKNYDSNRTDAAIRLGALAAYRIIMTGTPISRDVEDLYAQFKFLDEKILGYRYITTFRNRYCEYQNTPHGPKSVGNKNVDELYAKIDPYIFRVTKEEALDLPPCNRVQRHFVLTGEQLAVMKELKDEFFVEFGNNEEAIVKNAAGLLTRLQQISCGYLPLSNGEIKHFKNPRLDELLNVLDQYQGKVAIWCRFQEDVEVVMQALGDKAVAYYGPTTKDERTRNKVAFIEDESVRYFVATAATGGTGLDGLQKSCHFNVYYSNSFNALDRWQSEGRVERDGTTQSVTHMDLIARKSPDLRILNNLRQKKDIATLTLDDFRQLLAEDTGELLELVS